MTRIATSLPNGLVFTRRTPLFTHATIPAALLSAHSVKAGVWGLLRVESGRVRYCLDTAPAEALVVEVGGTVAIEPEAPHHVELLDADSAFLIEFHRTETDHGA